ncbi:MAG: hypothetical protein HQL65_14600 [Magnetococcales bacterium]|nr:hypothetical protein [Magnetococcales bacterium]
MPLQGINLKQYGSETVSDTSANGGRISSKEIADSVKNNFWPDVPESERLAGSDRYRKAFLKVANADGISLRNARIYVDTPTSGDDRVLIFPGTQTNIQDDITGSERLYGAGWLEIDAEVESTSISVQVENADDFIFRNGDLIVLTDQTNSSGKYEFVRLAASDAVIWNGDKATLVFDAGHSLQNAYTASATRVASVIEAGDVQAIAEAWDLSSQHGTYDGWDGTGDSPTLITLDAIGGIEQTWTISFTSPAAFTCFGDTAGFVGGGSTTGDFSPNNQAFDRPYFTLPASGWGGSWAPGDLLIFTTHPAAFPIWQRRIVPAGSAAQRGNGMFFGIWGLTA